MVLTHNLGFPRIGANRELKFALERYWSGESSLDELKETGAQLRKRHWALQKGLDHVPVGDFSFYDQMLDMSFTLGHVPERARGFTGDPLDNLFRIARGRSANPEATCARQSRDPATAVDDADAVPCCGGIAAAEMTKWFDTNYHYLVPEFTVDTRFELDASRLVDQLAEARRVGAPARPVLIGPVTYLALGKSRDGSDRLALLEPLLRVYGALLDTLSAHGAPWVQIDEPILVTELDGPWQAAVETAYAELARRPVKLLLATYFGPLLQNRSVVAGLPVAGVHVDAVTGRDDVVALLDEMDRCAGRATVETGGATLDEGGDAMKVVSLGIVDGRNVWRCDLEGTLDWLEPVAARLGDRLWLAPTCSLLHVPVDLDGERRLDPEIRSWLAFARQKLDELMVLARALNHGRDCVRQALDASTQAAASRRQSQRVRRTDVRAAITALKEQQAGTGRRPDSRNSPYAHRATLQSETLNLPRFPTTTIGSFPQTPEIRQARKAYRAGSLDEQAYCRTMQQQIERCVRVQESLGIDVLVHGEAERNDMVEYFGEQLDGFAISQAGWVQSYGSRCVKPPILYGDVSRPRPITVGWIGHAQSLTTRPVKGMLTGPVTMLCWSFVRDDQPRRETCLQLALAIRDEVLDLERAGTPIIQIDEAALREGMPLRDSARQAYLDWAVEGFRIAANGVGDGTQIHTHMCYSEFNDIIDAIAAMDADVITIETSRSDMELLDAFEHFHYPNAIGPGVYDIHSPNIPSREQIVDLMRKAASRIPPERLWINPDCGLKTRRWDEVRPALQNMVQAAMTLREAA